MQDIQEASITFIQQYQDHCDTVIANIEKIIEEEVLEHLVELALILYSNEECETGREIAQDLYRNFCMVLLYKGLSTDSETKPLLHDFREKILDVMEHADRKIKLIFDIHTPQLFFFK